MSAFTHWLDGFINIMQGLCIGAVLTVAFLILVWIAVFVMVGALNLLRGAANYTGDPKHVYPPYIKGDE